MREFNYKTGDDKTVSMVRGKINKNPAPSLRRPVKQMRRIAVDCCPRCWHRLEGFLWKCACGSWEEVSAGVYRINK